MKVVPFKVPTIAQEMVRVQEDQVPHFYDKLHQHPETQLMLILKSEGTLIAGDYVGRFEPNDLFLIGGGQPHVFRNDESYHCSDGRLIAHSISIYFDEQNAGNQFWQLDELKSVRLFLERSFIGFKIKSTEREEIARIMLRLPGEKGLEKLISFFSILKILSSSTELIPLSVGSPKRDYTHDEGKRMNDILHFTFSESHRKILLSEVARIANLSEEAFCRYFKTRTGKTYSNFLNEVRVSNACKLLIAHESSIEQVCYRAGFNNLSNFNRVFKKITGKTPSKYIP